MGGHFDWGGAAVVIPAGSIRDETPTRKAKYRSTIWCGRNRDHLPEFPHGGAIFLNEAEIRMRCSQPENRSMRLRDHHLQQAWVCLYGSVRSPIGFLVA